MKFGFRTPSIRKRLAARTSWKRVVRHRLGVKMPRGFGWFSNPRKAAYNRVYNRVTVSPIPRMSSRRSYRWSVSWGMLLLYAIGFFMVIHIIMIAWAPILAIVVAALVMWSILRVIPPAK
jgi:hypothetical protein